MHRWICPWPKNTSPIEAGSTSASDGWTRSRARGLRVVAGNFSDCKPVAEGVWELRIDWGPGYRVYYAQAGKRLVLLLTGGDKRKQQADIAAAVSYWNDWKRSNAK